MTTPMFAASQTDAPSWSVLAAVLTGFLAVAYLLPTPRRRPAHWGLLGIVLALVGFAFFLRGGFGRAIPITIEAVLFTAFALFAVLFAILMITQRNPARSAVFFAVVVLNVCGLFLLQGAPFLSAATVIIYAGAIIVTFLFVLMLSHSAGPSDENDRSREPSLAAGAGFVILATLLIGLERVYDTSDIDALLLRAGRYADATTVDPALRNTETADAYVRDLRAVKARLGFAYGATSRHAPDVRKAVSALEDGIADLAAAAGSEMTVAESRDANQRIRGSLTYLKAVRENRIDPDDDVPLSPYSQVRPAALVADPGPNRLPAANVAALGRSLFTDHLIAVELAGTLLLVATIGAIAIAGGRRRGNAEA